MKKVYRYKPFSASRITPKGWLARQLRIQAEGLAGNLDKVWPDVQRSRWIGGDREGWERVPYWLDGMVPLAWLLDDDDLKARAKRYIDAILAGQNEDGWICPCTKEERNGYDMWAAFLILKVLALYADASGDERVVPAVEKALHQLNDHVGANSLFAWGHSRWFECLIPIFWLYEKKPAKWLLDLADRLRIEGLDWDKMSKASYWHEPRRFWTYDTHVVNLALAIKAGGLCSVLDGETPDGNASEAFLDAIRAHHSTCWGLFTGDECLSGPSPIQGTELCAVVEAMYSFETLLALTGDASWGDRLEMLAFNALPATTSADMWTHQYDQSSNQPNAIRFTDPPIFGTNSTESSVFGLEPNYGCCTANFGQGWPKFALHALLESEDGVFAALPVPATVETVISGSHVKVEIVTDYPFRNKVTYRVSSSLPTEFTLRVRVPGSLKKASFDGKDVIPGEILEIKRTWAGETDLVMALTPEIEMESRPEKLFAVRRGPLFYSLPVKARRVMHEYTLRDVERKAPYCDYELFADSSWAYAFASDEFSYVETGDIPSLPFDPENAPCGIRARLAPIAWGDEPGHPAVPRRAPESTKPTGEVEEFLLVPYGSTDLRMTELPKVDR